MCTLLSVSLQERLAGSCVLETLPVVSHKQPGGDPLRWFKCFINGHLIGDSEIRQLDFGGKMSQDKVLKLEGLLHLLPSKILLP